MNKHPLVLHFIALVDSWNAAGWGEYLLWEVVEGARSRPFRLLDPLPEADLEVCRRLRDELKVWPYWDGTGGGWDVVSIRAWQAHAKNASADDIRDALERST